MEVSERPRLSDYSDVSATPTLSSPSPPPSLRSPIIFTHHQLALPSTSSILPSSQLLSLQERPVPVAEAKTILHVSDETSKSTTIASDGTSKPLARVSQEGTLQNLTLVRNRTVAKCRSLTSQRPLMLSPQIPPPCRKNLDCDGSPETFKKRRRQLKQVFASNTSKNFDESQTPTDVESTSSDNRRIINPIQNADRQTKKGNLKDLRRKLLTLKLDGKLPLSVVPVECSDAMQPHCSRSPATNNETPSGRGEENAEESSGKTGKRRQKKRHRARSLPVKSNDPAVPKHRTTIRAERQRRKEARRIARELRAREEAARHARASTLARQRSLQARATRAAAEEADEVRRGLERLGVRSPPVSLLFMNSRARHPAYSDENPLHESHDGTVPPFPSEGTDEETLRRLYVHMLRAALDCHCHRRCCLRRHAALRCQWWRMNMRETPCIYQRLNALPQAPVIEQSSEQPQEPQKQTETPPAQQPSDTPAQEQTGPREPLWKQYARRLPWPLWSSPLVRVRRRFSRSASTPPPPPPRSPSPSPERTPQHVLLSNLSPASSLDRVGESERDILMEEMPQPRRSGVRWCCW